MISSRFLITAALIICGTIHSACAQSGEASSSGGLREIEFAERVVMNELVRALSRSTREMRAKCGAACVENGALELGIGLLGLSQSDAASDALINFLGLRLDGAGSEELSCQIVKRGNKFLRRLKELNAAEIGDRCRAAFLATHKRELAYVTDVTVEQVCRTPTEIQGRSEALIASIRSKAGCEY